jgi:transcriptional regulator with XRE-family HTH domain
MSPEAQKPLPGIARNLTRLIDERQLSIEELSQRSEISKPKLEVFLAGEAEPTASDLLRLAGAMDVRLSQILGGIVWESNGKRGGSFRGGPEAGG